MKSKKPDNSTGVYRLFDLNNEAYCHAIANWLDLDIHEEFHKYCKDNNVLFQKDGKVYCE